MKKNKNSAALFLLVSRQERSSKVWSKIRSDCHVTWKHICFFLCLLLDLLLEVREEHPLPCILEFVPFSVMADKGQLILFFLGLHDGK